MWPRAAKSVPVTPQARLALGLDDGAGSLTPDQLISAILAAPVGLLWNGGIGTYVKASTPSSSPSARRACGDTGTDFTVRGHTPPPGVISSDL